MDIRSWRTSRTPGGAPAVTVVNTRFIPCTACETTGTNFYLYDDDTSSNSGAAAYYSLTEKNCADGSYCTEAPYTGACTDVAQGMTCASTACAENEYVSSNVCTACPVGMGNVAGDDVSGVDTTCDTICTLGQYDNSGTCTNCPLTPIFVNDNRHRMFGPKHVRRRSVCLASGVWYCLCQQNLFDSLCLRCLEERQERASLGG